MEILSKLKIKHSGFPFEVPDVSFLEHGELAINYADGKLFYKNTSNTITEIGEPLTYFTEAFTNSGINSTRPVVSLTVNSAEANIDLVLEKKGTGAILAQTPTGSSTGGNKRGNYAVDFQTKRISAVDVASGDFSVILNGENNRNEGDYAVICCGQDNDILGSSDYSVILGGFLNTINNNSTFCFIGSGQGNDVGTTSTSTNSVILSGLNNEIKGGNYNVILGGESNVIQQTSEYSSILNGMNNTVTGKYSTVFGRWGKDFGRKGAVIHAGGTSSTNLGQAGKYIITENLAASESRTFGLFDLNYADTDEAKIITPLNSVYLVEAFTTLSYVSPPNAADHHLFRIFKNRALIKKGATHASISIVWSDVESNGDNNNDTVSGQTYLPEDWIVNIEVDTSNGAIKLVGSDTLVDVRVFAKIETLEMVYA